MKYLSVTLNLLRIRCQEMLKSLLVANMITFGSLDNSSVKNSPKHPSMFES